MIKKKKKLLKCSVITSHDCFLTMVNQVYILRTY